MSSTGAFRISINGFNKSDVLNHINEMQKSHVQEVQALQDKIEQLQKQCDVAVKVAQASKEQLAASTARQTELEEENSRLQALVEEHLAANLELRNQLREYEAMRIKIQDLLQQSKNQQNHLLDELGRLLGDLDSIYQQLKLG